MTQRLVVTPDATVRGGIPWGLKGIDGRLAKVCWLSMITQRHLADSLGSLDLTYRLSIHYILDLGLPTSGKTPYTPPWQK